MSTPGLRANGLVLSTHDATVYLSEYGAKGDGTTDDTAAINSAVTATPAGGTLVIPPGKYKITTTITINKQINVVGAGPSSEIWIALTDPTKQGVVFGQPYPTGTTSAQGMTIRDFSVQGVAGSCFNGVAFYQLFRSHVSNLYVMPGSTAQAVVVGGAIASDFDHIVISKNITGLYDASAGSWAGAAFMVADLRNGTPVQAYPGGAVMPTNACTFSNLILEGGTTTGGLCMEAQDQGGGNNKFIGGTYEGFLNAGASAVKGAGYTVRIEGGAGFSLEQLDLESSQHGVYIDSASNFVVSSLVIPAAETVSITSSTNYVVLPSLWSGSAKPMTTDTIDTNGSSLALDIAGAAAWTLNATNNALNTAQGDGSGNIGSSSVRIAGIHALKHDGNTQTVAAAASLTLNPAIGENIRITLSATAITSLTVSAGGDAQVITVEVIQDGTGGRTIPTTWTNVVFAGGSYTATATLNKRDLITLRYSSADSLWYEMSRAMNL